MKDYAVSLEDKKDFILGYDITSNGMIKIKFAKGKPWVVPYNEENENKLLDKMKNQVKNAKKSERKLQDKYVVSFVAFLIMLGFSSISFTWALDGVEPIQSLFAASAVFGLGSVIPLINALKFTYILKDLRKNVKFLEMEEKLNDNVRSEENILVNVSSKTKNTIKDFPEDKPIFNINSFNYVPFSDLEQIIENVERNKRFGFNYSEQEEPVKSVVRKKTR